MIQTQLLLQIDGKFYDLDLYEDLPITANLSINSITELQERSAGFSNTFTLPGTKKNKERFSSFYEVSGVDFNPLTEINCVIQSNGADIFRGNLRLNSVINTGDYQEFEVYITTDVGSFVSQIDGLKIKDINFNDLLHTLDYDNITTSWEATSGDTAGLFGGKILYGLANFGYPYYSGTTTPNFTISTTGTENFTLSGNPVPEYYFKPQIRVKEIVERIVGQTDYTLISDFFDTPYFRSIYMTLADNAELGVNAASAATNQNFFRVYTSRDVIVDKGDIRDYVILPFNSLRADGFDFLNNYRLYNNTFPIDDIDGDTIYDNYFTCPYPGDYYFNIKFSYRKMIFSVFKQNFDIKIYKNGSPNNLPATGTLLATFSYDAGNSFEDLNLLYPLLGLSAGDKIYVVLQHIPGGIINDKRIILRGYGNVIGGGLYYDLYNSPNAFSSANVDVNLQMPDMTCTEFMKSIINAFNLLVIEKQEEKTLELIPYNDYFNQPDRVVKDWTDKLSLDNSWSVSTLDFSLTKNKTFTYLSGANEVLNKYQETNYNTIFGTKEYVSTSNILQGTEKITIPFAPTPTINIPGSEDFIIPEFFEVDDQGLIIPSKTKKPHLVFWVGNRFCYEDQNQYNPFTWYMSSGSSVVQQTTYPCISHLSNLTTSGGTTFADLNFDRYWDYWQSSNTLLNAYSNNTLFDTFYGQYINQLYSTEARKLEGKFVLNPQEIGELNFNDIIFIKDTNYRLQELKDANLLKTDLNNVVLVKELGGFNSVELPSNTYTIQPGDTPPPPSSSGITLNYDISEDLGAYATFIQNSSALIYRNTTELVLDAYNELNTTGSVSTDSGNFDIQWAINYKELGGGTLYNLRVGIGTTLDGFELAQYDLADPEEVEYIEVSWSGYIHSSENLYFQITTY